MGAIQRPIHAGKDTLLAALRKGPDAHGRVVAGCGEALIVWRESESAYRVAMCGPRGEVVHIGLEILDDTGLVCGRDVGAGVVEGERGQYAATLWRPLEAASARRHG